jgi:methylated-DNA-[protein]-cysteine S-methyltransferase
VNWGKVLRSTLTCLDGKDEVMSESMVVSSPVGNLELTVSEGFLIKVEFVEDPVTATENELLSKTAFQLEEYFSGKRKNFELPLKMKGTPFQEAVWNSLLEIPYGSTYSYQDIAEKINNPKAVRAIGQANKANALPIIVPCHRVIGKDKSLTGYAGKQFDKKEKLLMVEAHGVKS